MVATMHYKAKPNAESNNALPVREMLRDLVAQYYRDAMAEGKKLENVYEVVLAEVELPLIQATMEFCHYNQSMAARVLGINRGTFRKKLAHYGML